MTELEASARQALEALRFFPADPEEPHSADDLRARLAHNRLEAALGGAALVDSRGAPIPASKEGITALLLNVHGQGEHETVHLPWDEAVHRTAVAMKVIPRRSSTREVDEVKRREWAHKVLRYLLGLA